MSRMSTIQLHLIEHQFKRQNPDASSSEVSEHLLRKLAESLAGNEALERLLRELFRSLDRESLGDPGSNIDCPDIFAYGEFGNMFHSLARGMLKASSAGDNVRFLCDVLNFCNQSEDGARLWHHLRSVKDNDGYTPLHRAVILGLRRVVKLLITPFCRITAEMSSGRPAGDPLEFYDFRVRAWADGHPLEFADFDVLHARTPEGWTALHLAAAAAKRCNNEPAVAESVYKQVIARGAGRGAKAPEGSHEVGVSEHPTQTDTMDVLMMMYDNIKKPDDEIWDFADNFWMTPLHYAVLCNNEVQVKQLLASETYERHVNAGDYHQKTPLHMAVCHLSPFLRTEKPHIGKVLTKFLESQAPQPSIEMIRILGGCPRLDFHVADCCLYTPLHWAVHVGNTEAVKFLVSLTGGKRVRATRKDIEGRAALQIAVDHSADFESPERFEQVNWKYCNWKMDSEMAKLDVGGGPSKEAFEDIRQALLACDDVKDETAIAEGQRQVSVDGSNAILVAAALVAGSTFQGWLQPAINDGPEDRYDFKIFLWNNSLAFFFSSVSLLSGVFAILSKCSFYIRRRYTLRAVARKLLDFGGISYVLFLLSVYTLLFAYVSYGRLSPNHVQKNHSSYFFVAVILIPVAVLVSPDNQRSFCSQLLALLNTSRKDSDSLKIIRRKLKCTWAGSWRTHGERNENQGHSEQIKFVLNDKAFQPVHMESSTSSHLDAYNSRHGKAFKWGDTERMEDQQLDLLKRVYERVRKEMYCRNKESSDNMRFLSASGLMPREIHFWMTRCPLSQCRAHSLRMDRERWKRIARTLEAKFAKYRCGH